MTTISLHSDSSPVLSGNVANTGKVLTFSAGDSVELLGPGTITGGTIVDNGATLGANGEALAGVTYDGTMVLDYSPAYGPGILDIVGGLVTHGVNGTGAGTIDVARDHFATVFYLEDLNFANTQTIDNATINLGDSQGDAGAITAGGDGFASGQVLTLGKGLTINAIRGFIENDFGSSYTDSESVINNGTIHVLGAGSAAGELACYVSSFTNAGLIDVAQGASLSFANSTTNTGTIDIGADGSLNVQDLVNNGTINLASGSSAYLSGAIDAASLAHFVNAGGTLYFQGKVTGGTIRQAMTYVGGTLDGVTVDGTIDVETGPSGRNDLEIADGLTVHGSDGTGNGVVDVGTAANDSGVLYFDGTQTIDNATINVGSSQAVTASGVVDYDRTRTGGQILTFGKALTINLASGYIGGNAQGWNSESIVNTGTINATTGIASIDATSFANQGTITVAAGATLFLDNTWTNSGTIKVAAGGTIWLTGTWTNHGKIILASGSTAYVEGNPDPASLANIVNQGGTLAMAYVLTKAADSIAGTGATVVATDDTLSTGDTIDAGSGDQGTLILQGGGRFDLGAPTTLANFAVVDAAEQTGYNTQSITMRAGLNVMVSVASAYDGVITLTGANDADVFNLGAGVDTVTLGSAAEVINGGAGTDTIHATAASAGAVIHGGSGHTSLYLTGGGTARLAATSSAISTVYLIQPLSTQPAWAFTANAIAGLQVVDLSGAGDTITLGAASQSVFTPAGSDVVLATAATAGAAVSGGAGTVLEVTGGGTFALNAATRGIRLQLDQAATAILNQQRGIVVTGHSGGDTIVIPSMSLLNDNFDLTGSGNTVVTSGGGNFDLRQPLSLGTINTIDVNEGQSGYQPSGGTVLPATVQTIHLRDGLNATVNVAGGVAAPGNPNAERITIYGANDKATINLGPGTDAVMLGSAGETVNGGAGNDTINGTASTANATIRGGPGTTTLNLTGGGTVTLGSNATGITTVALGAAAAGQTQPAWTFTANAIAGLVINDRSGAGDTITPGAASQTVKTAAGNDVVRATAATAGVQIYGGAGTVLEVTGGGSFALNSATYGVTVQLDQASTVTLNRHAGIGVTGSAGHDTIIATSQLRQDALNPGGSGNTLVLSGAGVFDLNQAASITNIQTIAVNEGQAGYTPAGGAPLPVTAQTVYLRSGLNAVVNVTDGVAAPGNPNVERITIYGADDADVIHLGAGTDSVTLGSAAESIVAGSGNAILSATAATASAQITGNGSATVLTVTGGGTVALNAADRGLGSVVLAASGQAYDFTSNAQSGLTITDRSSGGDRISVGGASATVTGGAGSDTIWFHAGFGHAVVQSFTASGSQHDVLQFDTNVFADWAHLLAATRQQGSDLVITLDAKDTLLVKNVALANFTASDAKFA